MSGLPAEEAEVLFEVMLSLLLCEPAVFTELEVGVGLFLISIATARVSVARATGVTRVALSTIIVFILVGILSGVRICSTLPFIIRVFNLIGSQIFSGHLRTVLPILGVDGLGEGMEFIAGVRFADVGNFILDVGWM